jgi:hypothetical protein
VLDDGARGRRGRVDHRARDQRGEPDLSSKEMTVALVPTQIGSDTD